MIFYISTIGDVLDEWDEATQTELISYERRTGPIAREYGLGLELAEFCIAENCDEPSRIMGFFEENTEYSKDLLLHAPYNELFPHAIEPAVVRLAEKRYTDSYDICLNYGIKKMIVHANFVASLYFSGYFITQQIKFWKKFLKEHPGDTQLVIENVMENEPWLITKIVEGVDDERFKMCLDLGHANLHAGTTLDQWIDECAPYVSHLHIHNNNGPSNSGFAGAGDLHRGLGNGIIDYEYMLKKVEEKITYPDLTLTIESYEMKESAQWLRDRGFI